MSGRPTGRPRYLDPVKSPRSTPNPPVDSAAYRARAQQRRERWTAAPHTEPAPVHMDDESVARRLAAMAELAEAGWLLSGRPLPAYERSDMPGTVIRAPRPA